MSVSPGRTTPPPPNLARRPSLRWRLRRWVLQKLDAWPKAEPWEPATDWGKMRRAERVYIAGEVERLRALEERLTRWIEHLRETTVGLEREDWVENLEFYVVRGHLDEYLTELEADAD